MISILRSVLSIFVAAAVILFALANRGTVPVAWSPVHDAITIPVFLLGLTAAGLGFFIGGSIVWMNGATTRKSYRRQCKKIKKLEKKLQTTDADTTAEIGRILLDN
jgi:uncharacterized integral membrane protein